MSIVIPKELLKQLVEELEDGSKVMIQGSPYIMKVNILGSQTHFIIASEDHDGKKKLCMTKVTVTIGSEIKYVESI